MAIARKPPGEPPKKPGVRAKAPAATKPRRAPQPKAALGSAAKAPGTPRKKAVAAGPAEAAPKVARARRKAAEPSRLDAVQAVIVASLDDDKAENIVALDLVGRASFADRMVIATGIADRQISAMAAHLEDKLHEAGIKRVQIEGAGGSDWVLIDAGDIVVHLFKPEARELYGLERMWGPSALDDAPGETPD
jgi:ribosome silencing factor RsfS/YbeB/iojap